MGRPRWLVIAVAVTVLVVAALGGPANADDAFDITVSDAVDLPPRTVTFQGQTFTVSGTLRTDPGTPHDVEVDAPDVVYRVYVYNSDQQIVESRRGDGPSSFTFDFDGYVPGSYALVVNYDGVFEDVFPVVVEGYTVAHDAPDAAESGDSIEVTVDVTETVADEPPAAVTVIVADADMSVRTRADRTGDTYTATVSLAEVDAGTYTIWAVAQGNETAFGHQTVLGMSTPDTLDVATTGGTATDGSGGDADSNDTPTATAVESPPPTPTPMETDRAAGSGIDSTPETSDTRGDLITPRTASSPASGGISDGMIGVAFIGAAVAGVLLWRWS